MTEYTNRQQKLNKSKEIQELKEVLYLNEEYLLVDSRRGKKRSLNPPTNSVIKSFKKIKTNIKSAITKISTTKNKGRNGELVFTKSEDEKNSNYNSNIFCSYQFTKNTEKRMIIIDGSNVAFGHGNSSLFSTRGIEIVIGFFESKGHEVKAVVPQYRCNYNKSTDVEKLKELNQCGKLIFTPGKNLPDLRAVSYDDRIILQLALVTDAAVVSNDNYRDLINENPGFKKLIENRIITYTWCNDIFILTKDPYGRRGPLLDQILYRQNVN